MSGQYLELVLAPARSLRRGTIIWSVSMAGLVAMTIAFWPAFKESSALVEMIDQLPKSMIDAFGLADIDTPAGYLRGNLYDFFVPLLLAGAAIGFASGVTASEEDSGRMEVVLTQPVARRAVFLGRAVAALACLALVTLIMALAQFASDEIYGLSIRADRLIATIVLSGLLGLLHGGFALAIAGLRARPSLVLGVGFFVAVAGCVVVALFPLSEPLRPWAHLSPWDWAFGGEPLLNATEPWRYLALAVPAVALALLGAFAFGRRDIRAA